MYAVIKTGGKQYRVAPGEKIKIEQIPADIGAEIVLDQVLLVADGENLKMGRPLVAPNHGGAAEMAEHDANALLFEPGNPDSLAEMIRRLHLEPGLGKRLGEAARAKALRTFDVKSHVAEVEKVYDLLLK